MVNYLSVLKSLVVCFVCYIFNLEHYSVEDTQPGGLDLLTIEEASLFEAAYPEVVAIYQKQQSETKGKKQKSKGMLNVPCSSVSGESPDLSELILIVSTFS